MLALIVLITYHLCHQILILLLLMRLLQSDQSGSNYFGRISLYNMQTQLASSNSCKISTTF